VSLALLRLRFVEPLRVSFIPLVAVSSPAAVRVSATASLFVRRLSVTITITPALCAVAIALALALLWDGGRFFDVVAGTPGVELATASSISWPGLSFGSGLPISRKAVKGPGRAVSSWLPIVAFPLRALLVSVVAPHLAVEALCALGSEALARLHRAPSITVRVDVIATKGRA